MKLGFSSYCFMGPMNRGEMGIEDVIRWIGASGAGHMELATLSVTPKGEDTSWNLYDETDLLGAMMSTMAATGIELSGICIPADFLVRDSEGLSAQVERVKRYVELCDRLGVRFLRHDVTEWARAPSGIDELERSLPAIIDCSAEVADHAARYGVVTSIENHGFFINARERVQRVLHGVGRPNFKTTIDVGNFLCVDEDPTLATEHNLPWASFIHLKDFYVRPRGRHPGEGWLKTLGGRYILGSIIGFGDMDIPAILKAIRDSGFDGFVSIEFEGNEDSCFACAAGLRNVSAMLAEFPVPTPPTSDR